ncbi:MAG: OmpA family protein [Pseudomonadota bacterium]
MPVKQLSVILPIEEPPEDPPRCPPAGSPAWMSTFADIAILLMAFFVLILSFAEFNQPKFKLVSGSLQLAFGVQRDQPVMEQPKGTTILSLDFSPSPELSVTEQLTQDTTDTTQPEIVSQSESEEDGTGPEGNGQSESDSETEEERSLREALEALAQKLRQALVPDGVEVETRDGAVVVDFEDTDREDVPERISEVAELLAELPEEEAVVAEAVLLQGLTENLSDLARAAQAEAAEARSLTASQRQAAIAEAELRVALRQQVDAGLVTVEQRDDKVVVTVGAGGAFPSGEADLTDEARDIMARIAFTAVDDASDIVVTGHTDSVPLAASSPFRDNWGLAAARASSVVRELQSASGIEATRMMALSRGETAPVADNDTAEGRSRNRRIEIEFQY